MIPAERQKKILSLIGSNQVVSINTLVESLGVSHMTIRRDIKALEADGQVVCVSGGVQLIERLITEPSHDTKSKQNIEKKQAIGVEAAKYIPSRGTVFLDAGTTTYEIAKHIKDHQDLIIITNDFEIARYIMREGTAKLVHTGGTVNRDNLSCVGDLTASFISKISIDVAFISTSSWDADRTTTPDESKILVKRTIAKQSRFNILVTDSSKYGKVGIFQINDLTDFDMIITDNNLRQKSKSLIESSGIEVVTVDPTHYKETIQVNNINSNSNPRYTPRKDTNVVRRDKTSKERSKRELDHEFLYNDSLEFQNHRKDKHYLSQEHNLYNQHSQYYNDHYLEDSQQDLAYNYDSRDANTNHINYSSNYDDYLISDEDYLDDYYSDFEEDYQDDLTYEPFSTNNLNTSNCKQLNPHLIDPTQAKDFDLGPEDEDSKIKQEQQVNSNLHSKENYNNPYQVNKTTKRFKRNK